MYIKNIYEFICQWMEQSLLKNKAVFHKSCSLRLNNTKLERVRKQHATKNDAMFESVYTRSQNKDSSTEFEHRCFFCGEQDPARTTPSKGLRTVSTLALDANIKQCASQLGDKHLLTKLANRDLVAVKAKYHVRCLTALYNKCRSPDKQSSENEVHESQAFARISSLYGKA